VHLAPPARRKHIAHYVRLDKAEQKFARNVLQIDNACADGALRRAVVSADGLAHHRTVHYKCAVFGRRRTDQLNVKSDLSVNFDPND
jgi:hypothetical protein